MYLRGLIEVTTFFLYRLLSIDMRNRYSSMIDIDDYWLLPIISLSINYVWICPKFLHILIYSAIWSLDRTVFENCVFNKFSPEREVVKRRFIESVTSAIVWLKCWNCKYISHIPQIGLILFPLPSPPLSLSFKHNVPLNNRCHVCIFETITSE